MGSLVCNREVSAVTAACMLVRADAFSAVGGFDEQIAIGYGDVDLCLRLRQHGLRVLFCAHATLLHHESASRGPSSPDPHPGDTAYFLHKWRDTLSPGDPYFSPSLSEHDPNWQARKNLKFNPDLQRRVHVPPTTPRGEIFS